MKCYILDTVRLAEENCWLLILLANNGVEIVHSIYAPAKYMKEASRLAHESGSSPRDIASSLAYIAAYNAGENYVES